MRLKCFILITSFFLLLPIFNVAHISNNLYSFKKINGDVLYVGGNGPNNYTSIQDAINDAKDGYTIKVYPGIYNQTFVHPEYFNATVVAVVNKSVSLIGIIKNGEKPVIDAGGETGFLVLANNCTIEGFKFVHAAIAISGCENILIKNNEITAKFVGISIGWSTNFVIINNSITNCGSYAMEILYHHQNKKGNFTISHNNIIDNGYGIHVGYNDNGNISYNTIISNEEGGLSIDTCDNISIFNNTIGYHIYPGIQLMECSNCTVAKNEIYRNGAGIMLQAITHWWEPAHNNIITRNNIYSNSVGIYIEMFVGENYITYNNFDNRLNAYFWYDTHTYRNTWFYNYWSDWHLPIPKPIIGQFIFDVGSFAFTIPWLMFDWYPAMEPWEM